MYEYFEDVRYFIETGEDEDVYSSNLLCKGSLFRTQSGPGVFLSRRDYDCAKKHGMKQSVSGMQAETVKDPRMQKIRRPDRLADELAKGRPVEKVLR